ncbi:MAG: hypothetical protein NC347_07190 [Clostridium sp.]|nr:hypothetical protein [Clostridium sp.]
MIIGACGYGGTGSSAILDFMKEIKDTQVFDRSEFQYAFKVDGLQDLEYHLVTKFSRQMSGDQAIKRFKYAVKYANTPIVKKPLKNPKKYIEISNKYVDSLVQATWLGIDNADFETGNLLKSIIVLAYKKIIIRHFESLTGKLFRLWPMRTMYLSIHPDDFYKKTKNYTNEILREMGADFKKKIVLDQPFEGNDPTQSFPFFEDPIAFVIDRDPRDLYLAASYQWPVDGTFMPRRDPVAFVQYYKRQRWNQNDLNQKKGVMFLRLEDMIFNYDDSRLKILDFLNLENKDHIYPKKYFNPDISMKTVQLYKKIPGHDDEIKYIEEQLTDFLFPFEDYELSKYNTDLTWF